MIIPLLKIYSLLMKTLKKIVNNVIGKKLKQNKILKLILWIFCHNLINNISFLLHFIRTIL